MGDYVEYEQLQESPRFKEIVRELMNGLEQWQTTKTIRNAYIEKDNLIEVNKVRLYFINSVFTPLKTCHNCATRPCTTLVCTGKGVYSECGENIRTIHFGL